MLPRPPNSTLFPYTTLFRSELKESYQSTAATQLQSMRSTNYCAKQTVRKDRMTTGVFSLQQQVSDRKSTRLNSSHLVISYAVFCLKKKKKNEKISKINKINC